MTEASENKKIFIVSGIELPLKSLEGDAFFIAKNKLRAASLTAPDMTFRLYRRSIDARRRDNIKLVWSIAAEGSFGKSAVSKSKSIYELKGGLPSFTFGSERLSSRPVIVGSGPAGMFCALLLAENGYRPIVLERGGDISSRIAAVDAFRRERKLDLDNNIQFGAGGAGTFSDGKLVTRINDGCTSYVIDRLAEFGAPEEIRYLARPHIGTDYLRGVVSAILRRITELGGEVRYHSKLESLSLSSSRALAASVSGEALPLGLLVLAIGHSSRDTYRMLMRSGFQISAKPFSVGVRVEHLRERIDRAMYGRFAGHPMLGAAEYHLSADTSTRGVYTFCMCPGGEVVPAASDAEGVVVNGMSVHARDGRNSNSAVVVSVFGDDYGNTPEGAIRFQEKIERAAYLAGGGHYTAPACTLGEFKSSRLGGNFGEVLPSYMNGSVKAALPEDYLPPFVCASLRRGFLAFGRKIEGFDSADAVLTGPETRTSAPVRILRDARRTAVGFDNVYPCGEGAGYAGGITSAAVDGIHTAIAIMERYAPIDR